MRWIRDLALATLILSLTGGALLYQRSRRDHDAVIHHAAAELRRLELEVKYQSATGSTQLNARGWPVTIDPAWFTQEPPRNSLLSADRPWVEVAPIDQAGLFHPPVRMGVDAAVAEYWYNPFQGVVRARVPVMVSDEKATELYNRVNGTTISSIFFNEEPMPHAEQAPAAASNPGAETPPAGDADPAATPDEAGSPPAQAEPARREPMMVRVERTGPSKKRR